jgi:hypothetical protein
MTASLLKIDDLLLLALFGRAAISALSLLSGLKRKLDFEPAKGQLLAQSGHPPK